MALLPTTHYSDEATANILLEVRKGEKKALGEFIWQHQERFYCISFIATAENAAASHLTIEAFKNVRTAASLLKPKQIRQIPNIWEWLAQHAVDAVAAWHAESSPLMPADNGNMQQPDSAADLTMDGSASMDWETTIILGPQRVKRCINALPPEQKAAFVLRHQLGLNFTQTAVVLNQNPDLVMANLQRARVQVVKCLGRG
jgi:DNA-directed RNA polymerase specialized sigma24 family protein